MENEWPARRSSPAGEIETGDRGCHLVEPRHSLKADLPLSISISTLYLAPPSFKRFRLRLGEIEIETGDRVNSSRLLVG
jgi:hypothetical protein